jgi:glucose dehydrogenase
MIDMEELFMSDRSNDSNQNHVHAVSRREALIAGAALVASPFLKGVASTGHAAEAANTRAPDDRQAHAQAGKVRGSATEWLSYGGDKASSKYSPLDQIGRDNFNRLQLRRGDDSS